MTRAVDFEGGRTRVWGLASEAPARADVDLISGYRQQKLASALARYKGENTPAHTQGAGAPSKDYPPMAS